MREMIRRCLSWARHSSTDRRMNVLRHYGRPRVTPVAQCCWYREIQSRDKGGYPTWRRSHYDGKEDSWWHLTTAKTMTEQHGSSIFVLSPLSCRLCRNTVSGTLFCKKNIGVQCGYDYGLNNGSSYNNEEGLTEGELVMRITLMTCE